MKSSLRDRGEGMFHEVKGRAKEIAEELSDHQELEAEGHSDLPLLLSEARGGIWRTIELIRWVHGRLKRQML